MERPGPADQLIRVLTRLRRDLARALAARDAVATSALRTALAAVENAAAADPALAPRPATGGAPFAASVRGLGAAEVPRRDLTDAEVAEILRAEVAERLAAAADYDRIGHPERAGRLRDEAAVLTRSLSGAGGPGSEPQQG